MNKVFLSIGLIFVLLGQGISYAQMPYHDFPPTPAFRYVGTPSGQISAKNYYYPLNVTGGGCVSVTGVNSTHTMTISGSGCGSSTKQGSYNTTQANNVNINTNGYQINFINGSGSTVKVVNSHSGHQVNVTIASTGSGGTITGSGSSPQMTYWTGTSSIGGATNMVWDNANNILEGLSDVTTSLGTSSVRFLNIFASVINGTNLYTNIIQPSTTPNINMTTSKGHIYVSDYGCGTPFLGFGANPTLTGCSNYALLLAPNSDTLINRAPGNAIMFREGNVNQMIIASGGNVQLVRIISIYNNTNTVGSGVPAIIGIDNRHGLTTVDGSARTMFTTTDSTPLYEVIIDEEASSFVSGNMVYTVNWTENGGNNICQITVNSVLLLTTTKVCLANPDPSSHFKVQLSGPFVGTVTVSAVVERLG